MFDDHFEVFLADTEESKAIHYNIRYQVYCEEMGYENKENFPLEQEIDEYDNHSVHFIVRHKLSKEWIGATRLIIQKNKQQLPIELHCNLDTPFNSHFPGPIAEFSRLCLVKGIRRRTNDIDPPHGITDESLEVRETDKIKLIRNNHRINRSIIWGLIRAALEHSLNNNIQDILFLTTNALSKILTKGGFEMINIGEPCNHNGERFPYKVSINQLNNMAIWEKDYKNGFKYFSKIDTEHKFSKSKAA
jgi:N-acyl amino acid synthase of PEP-CTERM/exosortase system